MHEGLTAEEQEKLVIQFDKKDDFYLWAPEMNPEISGELQIKRQALG